MASAPNMLSGSGCWRMRSTEIYSTATERLFLLNAHIDNQRIVWRENTEDPLETY
jgi:hypothetical protein